MRKFQISVLIVLIFTSCDLEDTTNKISKQLIGALDNSIKQLQTTSDGWQSVAENLSSDVQKIANKTKDASLLAVKNDVVNAVDRIPQNSGTMLMCSADFLKDRFKEQLYRIKANLLGGKVKVFEPTICGAVPSALVLENKPSVIDFSGYNLDYQKEVKVYKQNRDGNKVDVTYALSQPSHYHWTLNLSNVNGIKADNQSDRILLYFKDKEVSSISIIQPNPKICESETKLIVTSTPKFVPPHINGKGDRAFGSSEVNTTISVDLTHDKKQIYAKVFMSVTEWFSDRPSADETSGAGETDYVIYTAPEGKEIEKINAPTHLSYQNVFPSGDGLDTQTIPMEGGMGKYQIDINRRGEYVVGTWTGVTLNFTQIPIVLKDKNNDCVSTNTYLQLSTNIQDFIFKSVNFQGKSLLKELNKRN